MMSGIFTSAGQKWLHKKQSLCTSVSNASWWKIYTKKTAITASLKLFWNLNTQQQTGSSHFFTVLAYFGSEVFFFFLFWAIPNTLLSTQTVLVRQQENLEFTSCLALNIIAPRTLLEATLVERVDEVCASLYKKTPPLTEQKGTLKHLQSKRC